jgi:glc operon protein GlcG
MQQVFELGADEAELAIATIRVEAKKRGKSVVIAVSDPHGELIAFLRMDGAPLTSVGVAMSKVLTAARERNETGLLGKAFKQNGWQMANSDIRFTGWDGGIPVWYRGQLVGAVAVSGLAQEEDAELARLGIAKILERAGE